MAYIIWFNLLLYIVSVQNSPVKQKHECRYCNATTLTHKEYLEHLETHKEQGVKKYDCPHIDCNATIQGKDEYNKHFQTHDKPFRYQCKPPGCRKEFCYPSSFSKHKESCQYKPQIERKRKCRYCTATIQMGKEYSKHLETHKEQGLYKCTWSTCGKKWRTLKSLRQHYEKHQSKLLCEICGSFFSYKKGLRRHKKQCHGVR
ncbi:hypothetical protein LOAG_10604, partial [Loa loa]